MSLIKAKPNDKKITWLWNRENICSILPSKTSKFCNAVQNNFKQTPQKLLIHGVYITKEYKVNSLSELLIHMLYTFKYFQKQMLT